MPRWAFGAIVVGMFIAAVAGTTGANEPGAATAATRIDWSKCGERLECAQRPGALGLGSPGRGQDLAGGRPPPRQPARAADRLPVRQLWRSWCRGGRRGERGGRTPGRAGRGTVRRGRLGSARDRRKHACALLCQRIGPGTVLGSGLDDPDDTRGVTTLCAQDHRLCAALRGAERRLAGPHLHRRYGPRPRLSAPAGRRSPADLSRPLLRHVSRPDLRQHVPAPGAGDDPGRRDRCGRVT